MLYFSVIRNIIADRCYYYFGDDEEIIYQGYDLPKELDELLILDIDGGEDAHGNVLYFSVSKTQYFKGVK